MNSKLFDFFLYTKVSSSIDKHYFKSYGKPLGGIIKDITSLYFERIKLSFNHSNCHFFFTIFIKKYKKTHKSQNALCQQESRVKKYGHDALQELAKLDTCKDTCKNRGTLSTLCQWVTI